MTERDESCPIVFVEALQQDVCCSLEMEELRSRYALTRVENQHDIERYSLHVHQLDPLAEAVVKELEVVSTETRHCLPAAPDIDVNLYRFDDGTEYRPLRLKKDS
jgi:hypothetical protein